MEMIAGQRVARYTAYVATPPVTPTNYRKRANYKSTVFFFFLDRVEGQSFPLSLFPVEGLDEEWAVEVAVGKNL